MKTRPKQTALLCLALIKITPVFAHGTKTVYEGTRIKHIGQVVEINVGLDFGNRNAPLEELSAALKWKPVSSKFKVAWSAVIGGGNYKGVVIYNRTKKTVELYAYETFEETVFRYHRLYSGVSESILLKAAQTHKISTAEDNGLSPFGFFNELTKYGCKERKINEYKLR